MDERKRIVVENYPASDLPAKLRGGIDPAHRVHVVVEDIDEERMPRRCLIDFLGAAKGVYGDADEAVAYVRALRDEWECCAAMQ